MGLDRDDTVARRRMRQKLGFLSDDLVAVVEPTEEDLRGCDSAGDYFDPPDFWSFSMTCSRLKLAAFCRGGYFLNLDRNFAT